MCLLQGRRAWQSSIGLDPLNKCCVTPCVFIDSFNATVLVGSFVQSLNQRTASDMRFEALTTVYIFRLLSSILAIPKHFYLKLP